MLCRSKTSGRSRLITPFPPNSPCAKLVAIEGRRLVFRVTARDAVEMIGEGRHDRVVVDAARFGERLATKAGS